MKLTAVYQGAEAPFEGDRELLLRALPADARVLEARAVVRPARLDEADPFLERIRFSGGTGDWGATEVFDEDPVPWVEVDFHARRMLASVEGSGGATTLQIDLGGTLVAVTSAGTFFPPDGDYPVELAGSPHTLPGLAVTRFRLTSTTERAVAVDAVTVRSYPTNVTLRLGDLGPFWFSAGELTGEERVDFTSVLEGYLARAEVADGAYVVPFIVHSDLVARLEIELEVEYVRQRSALPDGLTEVLLAFDHSSLAHPPGGTLTVELPPGARAMGTHTGGSVIGVFDSTRVVLGEIGDVAAPVLVPVTPERSQAQPFEVSVPTTAGAIDLLLAAPG